MKENPLELKAGERVILDQGFINAEVTIVEIINDRIVTIKSKSSKPWEVKINRLTPIEQCK